MRCAIAQPCCGSPASAFRISMSRVPWSKSVGGGIFPSTFDNSIHHSLVECQGGSPSPVHLAFHCYSEEGLPHAAISSPVEHSRPLYGDSLECPSGPCPQSSGCLCLSPEQRPPARTDRRPADHPHQLRIRQYR